MPDKGHPRRGIAGKEPSIAVRAAVELLHPVLIGLRTARGVLYPIRRDDAVSGLAQSGDNAGGEGIRVAAWCFIDRTGDDPLYGWVIGLQHVVPHRCPGANISRTFPVASARAGRLW